MGSSYSRRTRDSSSIIGRDKDKGSVRSKGSNFEGASTIKDLDNNFKSDGNVVHERKDSKKFWISHVKFRKRSSSDLRRAPSEKKAETRTNPKSTSSKQTGQNSKVGLNKSLSVDSSAVMSCQGSSFNDKANAGGCETVYVSAANSQHEEKKEFAGNSAVVKQTANLNKQRLLSDGQLYNILNDGALSPCICDPTYILILDTRSKQEYDDNHILTARHVSSISTDIQTHNVYGRSNINIPEFTWVVIYGDGINDDDDENKPEVKLMQELESDYGSDYDVEPCLLSSGFKSFRDMFPFMCSDKERVDFKSIQAYPSIILDDQLYQGRGDQATNLKVVNDLQITHIVNITQEHMNAFPDKVEYLTLKLDDVSHTQLIKHFDRTTDFLAAALGNGGRVLVHCNLGVSRSSTVSIAYLIQSKGWTLSEAYDFLKDKRTCIRPNRGFLQQLAVWEELQLGKRYTDPDDLWF